MRMYPQPHPQTAGRVIDGEAVLILSDSSEVNVLNTVGSRIFELADGTLTVAQIVATIAAEYDASPEQVGQDAVDFVARLVKENVLTLSSEPEH